METRLVFTLQGRNFLLCQQFLTMKKLLLSVCTCLVMASCVSPKKVLIEYEARRAAEEREATLRTELADAKVLTANLTNQIAELSRKIGSLEYLNGILKTENDDLKSRISALSSSSSSEREQLSQLLDEKNKTLAQKEQVLNEIEAAIKMRSAVLKGLFPLLDSTMQFFRFDGIKTEYTQDKVVVLLPAHQLFDGTGQKLSKNGLDVLARLAPMLENRPNVDITVEGHTDNTKPKSSRFSDNWDLSALQATLVVRALTKEYGILANQVTAAARGEFLPRASNETKEGQAENRRIEIVITPKISDLLRTLEKKLPGS